VDGRASLTVSSRVSVQPDHTELGCGPHLNCQGRGLDSCYSPAGNRLDTSIIHGGQRDRLCRDCAAQVPALCVVRCAPEVHPGGGCGDVSRGDRRVLAGVARVDRDGPGWRCRVVAARPWF
jgi:hypothetical protein